MTGLDFSAQMLERARGKPRRGGRGGDQLGAAATPLRCRSPDDSFAAATVGFGLRNLPDLERRPARARARRAARRPRRRARDHPAAVGSRCKPFYGSGSTASCPRSAACFDSSAYSYLPASVRRFPAPTSSARMFWRAGHARRALPAAGRRHRGAPRRGGGRAVGGRGSSPARRRRPRDVPGRRRGAPPGDRRIDTADRSRAPARDAARRRQAPAAAAGLPLRSARQPPAPGVELAAGAGRARAHGDARARRRARRGAAAPRPSDRLGDARPGGRGRHRRLPLRPGVRRARGDRRPRGRSAPSRRPRSSSPGARRCRSSRRAIPRRRPRPYLERCRLKTGRLFAAACALGGRLGGLDPDACAALDRFGELLGLAFQLADDVLDCAGDPKRTGKALGTDLLDGTTSLPLLLAARSRRGARQRAARAGRGGGRAAACSRASPRPARSTRSAILPSGTRNAPRPSSSGHRARDTAALRALLRRAIDRDS